MTFEEKIKRIDQIAGLLDAGNLTLDDMTVLYEEGLKLAHECREYIEKAELKIIDITKKYSEPDN